MERRKLVCWILGIALVLWLGLAAGDCIRLQSAPSGTRPVVTVSEEKLDRRVTYQGLGYTVSYYVDTEQIGNDLLAQNGYGAEFRVLGILIWAWVE